MIQEDEVLIVTPLEIESVVWEGELVPSAATRGAGPAQRPVAAIGKHEVWPAAQALEAETGKKWTPPLGGADFWLVQWACTLREPGGSPTIAEATQTLYLRPHNPAAGERAAGGGYAAYAYSLFPDRLTVEDQAEFSASLTPELKFSPVEVEAGGLGAKIQYRKVFPVIQAYDVGTPTPYWVFKRHAAHPLAGSQFVYAVVAAQAGAGGVRGSVELVVTVESRFGPLRLGLPQEAMAHVGFVIP